MPNQSNISSLPYLPLQTAWIEQHSAFHDPGCSTLLPAVLKLMFAAWRGIPAGSIPSSHAFIAQATGLSIEQVSKHFMTLTEGYVLADDGRLHHEGLSRICGSLSSHYGKEIEQFAMSLAMSSQSPQEFAVASLEATNTKRPRGKTALPKDWTYLHEPDLVQLVVEQGFTQDHQRQWLLQRFRDYCFSRDIRSKDFDAEFRLFTDNTVSRFADQIPPAVLPASMDAAATVVSGLPQRTTAPVLPSCGPARRAAPVGYPRSSSPATAPIRAATSLAPSPAVGTSASTVAPVSYGSYGRVPLAHQAGAGARGRMAGGFHGGLLSKGEDAQNRARSSLEVARARMQSRAASVAAPPDMSEPQSAPTSSDPGIIDADDVVIR